MTLTELQHNIVDFAVEHPNATNADVADAVDCSSSYVREIRHQYFHLIEGGIEPDRVWPVFSDPYAVYVSDSYVEENDLSTDDPVYIAGGTEETTQQEIVGLSPVGELDLEKERRGLFYATREVLDELSRGPVVSLKKYLDDESQDLEIHEAEQLSNYLNEVDQILRSRVSNCDIFVGISILDRIQYENWLDGQDGLVNTNPFFFSGRNTIISSLEGPKFVNELIPTESEPQTPEAIDYICSGQMSNGTKSRLQDQILSRKYTLAESDEIYPSARYTDGPYPSVDSEQPLKITEDNVNFYTNKERHVRYSGDIDPVNVSSIFDDRRIRFKPSDTVGPIDQGPSEKQLSAHSWGRGTIIFISNFSLNIRFEEDRIIWSYPEPFESLVDPLIEILVKSSSIKIVSQSNKNRGRLDRDNWVFDTNAIYHEIDQGVGSSILRTVLADTNIAESTVHIPWIVSYEINKHKDIGGPNKPIQENGVDNLELLDVLDENGFIDLSIEMYTGEALSDITESSIADLYLSKFARERDAVVVTGDRRLQRLNQLAGIETADIYSYADVDSIPDLEDEVKEEVLNNVGTTLSQHSDIIEELESRIENHGATERTYYQALPKRRIDEKRVPQTAKEYLRKWVKNDDIIPYPATKETDSDSSDIADDGKEDDIDTERVLAYEHTQVHDLVPTIEVVSDLCESIVDVDGEKYLPKSELSNIAKQLGYGGRGEPTIHFHFPIALVISFQSRTTGQLSREGQELYQLKQLQNAKYTTEELSAADRADAIHDAILLAKERNCTLLCAEDDTYLKRVGDLLGVRVKTYS